MDNLNPHAELLIKAQVILTQNQDREVLEHAGLAVGQGLILDIGDWEAVSLRHPGAKVLDLGRSMLLPGLVNAHTHAPMTLFRGAGEDMLLMDWLTQRIWPLERELTPELIHLGALLACAEMIRFGTRAFLDGYMHEEEVGRAADTTGLRAVLGEGFFRFPSPLFPTAQAAWDRVEFLRERFAGHPRIGLSYCPHTVYTTDPEDLAESYALARKHGLIWQTHCSENAAEIESCLSLYGKRPLALLAEMDLLGPGTVLHHCVDLTQAEMALLAETRTGVVHCPESNMKLGCGQAPVRALLKAGVAPALGTDGAASNNNLNLFGEMRRAALLQKVASLDPTALPAQTALDMATRHGAAVLALPGDQGLVPNAPADLIALDLTFPNLMPLHNPVSQAVYAACGQEVRLNMVDGRILYRDGCYLTLDYPGLSAEVRQAQTWVKNRLPV